MSLTTYAPTLTACCFAWLLALAAPGCAKEEPAALIDPPVTTPVDTTTLSDGPVDFSAFSDTYADVASADQTSQWAHYNVHDPSYLVDGDFTYSFNTDVAFGHEIRPGIQIRRSLNLVEWEFLGWAFPGLPTQGANFIRRNGGEPFGSLWAPYSMKVGNEYRLYYSLSSAVPRLSVIGLATATSPRGPYRETGLVVTSLDDGTVQTNAIDPTVVVDPSSGAHWMYYGSAWDGIYRLELDPATGLARYNNDKGERVAQRGFTGNTINGNIEGPEIIYHPEFDKYYLFIAYDWLQTKYNVRVGRADRPEGPFYDIAGRNMNEPIDDLPMILAPYRFKSHSGWQGVSHPGVFARDGAFYMGHQGRPGVNSYFMVMHVRQLFWTEDGWPLVSSQRFATETETPVEAAELAGDWELIVFDYRVVPGYAEEQVAADFNDARDIQLGADGTVSGAVTGSWTYEAPWLNLDYENGRARVRVERGRDWENEVATTILFTGLNENHTTLWGKKIP
ncbi:arabinan endo-1,5-alpha-L-arabinosidase [Neolewinella litorea]|uniref:Arabinan endo-1,5-alpha-L-arabinosidase n=1 Tax=Neolewinella litorea TaxID=2562452 RepID=A0A4S4NC73_9BACT|nr:arabinan endo-1,5-alpha-L-arabinosidase [Neolewinella litorea]THH36315.1 arabinan endo-1,5-alpha-L-arabinosidase [Neolewinella litorea]